MEGRKAKIAELSANLILKMEKKVKRDYLRRLIRAITIIVMTIRTIAPTAIR
jgi:hypothetical protein